MAAASTREQVDRENGHRFGLKGMKERVERSGGWFHLTSAPGKGVRIEVRLPRRRESRRNNQSAS